MYIKCDLYLFFLKKVSDFRRKNADVSRTRWVFWIFFRQGITVSSFIIVGYVWQLLGRRGPFCSTIREQPQKDASRIRLEGVYDEFFLIYRTTILKSTSEWLHACCIIFLLTQRHFSEQLYCRTSVSESKFTNSASNKFSEPPWFKIFFEF